jgi:hypothetical protein
MQLACFTHSGTVATSQHSTALADHPWQVTTDEVYRHSVHTRGSSTMLVSDRRGTASRKGDGARWDLIVQMW